MSLKAFHIIFISLSVLLAWGVDGWCIWSYFEVPMSNSLGTGLFSLAVGAALVCYEIWFVKKNRQTKSR